MKNELDLLKKPFDGISNHKSFKVKCREIASELLTNYGIECNNKIFRFAEIEFYYYDSEQYLKDKNQYKWQEVTYPRNDYEGGQLFYHLLGKIGTDIHDGLCFFDGSLVKDDWNPKRDRFDTVTYAPYLEFALFLSHKTRQTISFFVSCLVVLFIIYIFVLSKITHFTE